MLFPHQLGQLFQHPLLKAQLLPHRIKPSLGRLLLLFSDTHLCLSVLQAFLGCVKLRTLGRQVLRGGSFRKHLVVLVHDARQVALCLVLASQSPLQPFFCLEVPFRPQCHLELCARQVFQLPAQPPTSLADLIEQGHRGPSCLTERLDRLSKLKRQVTEHGGRLSRRQLTRFD